MIESKTTGTYNVPIEKVWKVISDFTSMKWYSYIVNVRAEGNTVGSKRIVACQVSQESFEVVEELIKLDNANHITSHRVLKGPQPYVGMVCDLIVRKLDENKSELEIRYQFDPGQMPETEVKKMLDSAFEVARDDLGKFLKR